MLGSVWLVLVIALLAVAFVAYVLLGYGEPEVSRRCPECGLQQLMVVYPGQVQVVNRFECRACGAAYRESSEGTLVREQ
jgi:transposase-like protein